MTQTASTSDKAGARPAKRQLAPSDESIWRRYSPHGELPLSGASSLALHLLIFGLMLLTAWLAYSVFGHTSRSLPVEAVRLDLGGGGGDPHARGSGSGRGQPEEVGAKPDEADTTPDASDTARRPDLVVDTAPRVPFKFDDTAVRYIHRSDTASSAAIRKLAEANIRIRLPDHQEVGRGQGGTGAGGGSGEGTGAGTGDGKGPGKGNLTQREKRMLRWTMLFSTDSGPDYVSQLQGLKAILAVPIREDERGREYRIIRNLAARPAKLLKEDITKIQRIYWIDDKPRSVMDVMTVLGVPVQPSHFVAFMPEALEEKLFELEKAYLKKHNPGQTEDDILETRFRINRGSRGFTPEVTELKFK